jgi:hypothetical protein
VAITKVSPLLIAVANNVVSTVVGAANQIPTITFDAQGIISAASNVALSVTATEIANDAVTADKLNVTGDGTVTQFLKSDADGSFTWSVPTDTTYTAGTGLGLTGTAFSLDLTSDQSWTGSQRGTITTDNDLSFDQNAGNNFTCTPAALGTLTFTNHTAGQSGYILLINTGGYAISAAATTKVTPTFLATVSTAGTYLVAYYDDGTNAYLTASGILA